jgi:hypothetical protein
LENRIRPFSNSTDSFPSLSSKIKVESLDRNPFDWDWIRLIGCCKQLDSSIRSVTDRENDITLSIRKLKLMTIDGIDLKNVLK